jgi:nitrilase
MAGNEDVLSVAIAQISPVWLDRDATLAKILAWVSDAADRGCRLVAFGEALLPGYPFWVERTEGARFESAPQKRMYAHYLDQAVQIEAGHLEPLTRLAADRRITVMLGCIERPADRGGHSVYASLVHIDACGEIGSVHRKLMPTHEERLVWAIGDGHGLRTHRLGAFTVGGLNCWENWIAPARAALYAQGEDLHVAVWPGALRNTQDITRFAAFEGRSFVLAASGLMRADLIPPGTPLRDEMLAQGDEIYANGGSCIAAPDGTFVVEPVVDEETLIVAELDHSRVREARHSFDPAGHYSRPDVLQIHVDRTRQAVLRDRGRP